MQGKTSIKKLGGIHIVYIDLVSGKPMPLSSYQDTPEFGFPQTFNSREELDRSLPGHSFEIFEEAAKSSQSLAKASPAIDAQVAAILGGARLKSVPEVARPLRDMPLLSKSVEDKAYELINKLKFAAQYANAKNKKEIDLKIDTLTEAFCEIFK